MNESAKGRLLVVSTALLWGLAGVCVKSITWGPMPIVAVRSFFSLLMLLFVKKSFRISFKKINILGGAALCCTGVLYVIALKLTNAGTAIVLQYVAPILVFLYEILFHGKKPVFIETVLTVLVFMGIVLSFADSIDITHVAGNILALLSGFCFAAQIIIMGRPDSCSEDCTVLGNLFSLVLTVPFLFTDGSVSFDRLNVIWLLILSVFQYALPNILYSKGSKKISPLESSLLLTIEPVFNPIPVALFCGELMGTSAVAGAALVIVSVTVYTGLPYLKEKFR